MEVLRSISLYVEDKDTPFVLIGGHAINYYGISRQTGDIDLLVRLSDKNKWNNIFLKLHYREIQNDTVFARYGADVSAWPIDLMYVDDSTFEKIYNDSEDGGVDVAEVKIISTEHLVLLKLHALKRFLPERFNKDYNDLISLLKTDKIKFSKTEFNELCLKYANSELYEKIIKEVEL